MTRAHDPTAYAGPQPLEPAGTVRNRLDAAALCGIYLVLVTVIPSRLVLSGLPLDIPPSMLAGYVLGLAWLFSHMVHGLGLAKGPNVVRTAMFLFVCAMLASLGYASRRYLPPSELNSADRTLMIMTSFVAVGLLVCDGVRTVRRLNAVVAVVVGAVATMSAIGLLQFFIGVDVAQYLVLPGLRENSPLEFVLARSDFRRPAGTAGHPIEFGVVCSMAVPLAAYHAFRVGASRRRAYIAWLCLGLIGTAAVVSLSRSAILGLVVALLLLLPTWPARRRNRAVVVVVGFIVMMDVVARGVIGTLLSLFGSVGTDPSIQGRTDDYASTAQSIEEHRWLGRGVGTYLPSTYGPLDNQYLGTLVETGVIGLVTLILLFLAGGYAAVRARRASADPEVRELAQTLLACLTVSAVTSATFDTFAFTVATALTFVLLGMSGALWRITSAVRAPAPPPRAG